MHELRERLPGLARGESLLEGAFARYAPARGTTAARAKKMAG